MNSIINLSAQQLRRAAVIKEQIQSLETELGRIFGSSTKPVTVSAPKKRHKMSAAGKARISAAAKARWAKVKSGKPAVKAAKPAAKPVKQAKRKLSAAARAKISASAKARWKKAKAAGKKTL